MTEIEFKAWHKKKKKMYTINEFRFFDNKLYYVALYITDNESLLIHMYDEPIILLRYANRKDKNAKKIWEGDIVMLDHPDYLDAKEIFTISTDTFHHDLCYLEVMTSKDIEIIGNRYENPELLKGDK